MATTENIVRAATQQREFFNACSTSGLYYEGMIERLHAEALLEDADREAENLRLFAIDCDHEAIDAADAAIARVRGGVA